VSIETPDDAAPADAVEPDAGGGATARTRRNLPVWQESILLLVVAVLLAVVLKALFVQAFYIPSASMEPGLQENDRILVEKPSYWFGHGPSRGDVIVFKDPGDWLSPDEEGKVTGVRELLSKVGLYPAGGHLVKRVIGVGGDTVTCCTEQGQIEVNGYPLDESSYIVNGGKGLPCDGPMIASCSWSSGVIPKGSVFVMGDNRDNSADSTVHLCLPNETDCTKNPFVSDDLVVGKVFAVVWPHKHWDWLTRPSDFDHVPAPQPAPAG
jgi:signal peptidase I